MMGLLDSPWLYGFVLAVAVVLFLAAVVWWVDGRRQERRRAERLAQRESLPFPFGGAR